MARSAASRADQAAEALEAFLRDQPAAPFSAEPSQAVVPSEDARRGAPVTTVVCLAASTTS